MTPPVADENLCHAYYMVAVTHVKERANMALEPEEVSFLLSSVAKLRISGHEHVVKIPVFINTSIIKKGEELLWYAPKVVKKEMEERPVKSLEVKLSGKRQKTSGK